MNLITGKDNKTLRQSLPVKKIDRSKKSYKKMTVL